MINRLKQRMKEDEGFTLIELLIVIVVLGILAAIVVFALSNQTSNSVAASCKADAKSVEIAQEAFRANAAVPGTFAANIGILTVPDAKGNTYLRGAPATTHYSIFTDTTGKVYVYPAGTTDPGSPYNENNNFDTAANACGVAT